MSTKSDPKYASFEFSSLQNKGVLCCERFHHFEDNSKAGFTSRPSPNLSHILLLLANRLPHFVRQWPALCPQRQLQSANAFCASVTRKSPAVRPRPSAHSVSSSSVAVVAQVTPERGREPPARRRWAPSVARCPAGCKPLTRRRFNCIAVDGRSSETAKTEKEVDPLSLWRVSAGPFFCPLTLC